MIACRISYRPRRHTRVSRRARVSVCEGEVLGTFVQQYRCYLGETRDRNVNEIEILGGDTMVISSDATTCYQTD